MKAPQDFKYSPNGAKVRVVKQGEEMSPADMAAAEELGLIKARRPAANKAQPAAPENKAG